MKIAISGSTGFIGTHLSSFLEANGAEIVPLKREFFSAADDIALRIALDGCDAVINLAGATINHRWTSSYKRKIMDSRILTTRKLVTAINKLTRKPHTLISISAVGIYSSDRVQREDDFCYGNTFLSQVCRKWEEEARKVSPQTRLVIPRLGVVLAKDGGALPLMLLPFRMFAGGRIASGNQGFSWIHIEDLQNAILFLLLNPQLRGVFNFTAPQIMNNSKFTETAAAVLHRPSWLPVPGFVFYLLYGKGHILMTEGQKAYPLRLLEEGFEFRYLDLESALESIVD